MRKSIYRMPEAEALALLARAPVFHLAAIGERGEPILRTLHGVLLDGAVAFHGAPAGEKQEVIGKPAVVSVEETVASIPSYFLDPARACPATTYFLAAQAHGVVEVVDEPIAKARVLSALMEKLQPEGGFVPIDAAHPLYRKAVAGIQVLRVPFQRVDGKAKLGQNRPPADLARVLEQLWRRGDPGDLRAIELVRRANPDVPTPGFLLGPAATQLCPALDRRDLDDALTLLDGSYWNEGIDRATVGRALLGSTAWVGARARDGTLIATARAISDGAKHAWIYDVAVAPTHRGRGMGLALTRFLLDHPSVRGARRVWLATRDAQPLYRRLGFRDTRETATHPARTEMVLEHTR